MEHRCGSFRVKGPADAARRAPGLPAGPRPAHPSPGPRPPRGRGPAPARAATSMEHRCCPDHGDVTSTWSAGPAGRAGPAPGAPRAPPAPRAGPLTAAEPRPCSAGAAGGPARTGPRAAAGASAVPGLHGSRRGASRRPPARSRPGTSSRKARHVQRERSSGRFIGAAVEIAGSELTNQAAAEVFSRVLGRRVKFRRLPMPVVRVALGREFYQMFRWFNVGGFQADITALRRDYPQLRLRTLEDWLREEGWTGRRAITVRRDKIGRPLPGATPPAAPRAAR